MGKIVVFENITLKTVPCRTRSARRHRLDRQPVDGRQQRWIQRIVDDTRGVQALLFGRRTYEFFAGRYSGSTNAVAELVSSIPKHVVSSTLTDASWTKTTVLSGDATTEVAKLEGRPRRDDRDLGQLPAGACSWSSTTWSTSFAW